MTLDIKVKFYTGRKFAVSVASRPGLLSRGITMACFCETGRRCNSDTLNMLVMNGNSTSTVSQTMKVGTGSSRHNLAGEDMIM